MELARPVIAPVPKGVERPRWSVMIPTFNCAHYLRATLESVLQQDPGPKAMQIEVVDDHSTLDDPERVVWEVGRGRVDFHRQASNVGHTRNFETCLQRSRGELVHQLHGDDQVRDGFYRAMERGFAAHPSVGAAFCRQIIMDDTGHRQAISPLERSESGLLSDWLATIATGQRLQTPAMVVRRSVYEHLGGFDRRLTWTEDWEMWVRIAAHYPVWYEVEPLAVYRMHAASSSGRLGRSGETFRDVRRAIGINREYLPPDRVAEITRVAMVRTAHAAIRRAHRRVDADDLATPLTNLREAVRCSRAPGVLAAGAWLLARVAWHRVGAAR